MPDRMLRRSLVFATSSARMRGDRFSLTQWSNSTMSTDSPTPPPLSRDASSRTKLPGIPLRFSLRSLLMVTTCFAFWCALVALLPAAFSQLLVGAIWFVATGWLVMGVVFGQGDQRAFCIGAVLVASSMWTGIGGQYMHGFHRLFSSSSAGAFAVWLDLMMIAGTAIINGWFCIWARRFFERPSDG